MRRRDFIAWLTGGAAGVPSFLSVVLPLAARAQVPAPANQATTGAANSIGQVANLTGKATATRGNGSRVALKVADEIYLKDVVQTDINSSLGITFDDQTTFSLSANTRIVIDAFVYSEGGAGNKALFNDSPRCHSKFPRRRPRAIGASYSVSMPPTRSDGRWRSSGSDCADPVGQVRTIARTTSQTINGIFSATTSALIKVRAAGRICGPVLVCGNRSIVRHVCRVSVRAKTFSMNRNDSRNGQVASEANHACISIAQRRCGHRCLGAGRAS
jgi:hypothetical protein